MPVNEQPGSSRAQCCFSSMHGLMRPALLLIEAYFTVTNATSNQQLQGSCLPVANGPLPGS
jgi:hypothetical protein